METMKRKTEEARRIHVRWMIRSDMRQVREIEQLCFDFPWSEEAFIKMLRQHCIGMVAEDGLDVLGFMVYSLHTTRIELDNLAVHPSCWRRGIGRELIETLKGKLAPQRRREVVAVVDEHNLDGQLFLRSLDFRATGTIRDGYRFVFEARD